MATGIVTRAEQNGENAEIDVAVDEGAAGTITYTGRVRIVDLKAMPSNAARKTALLAAVTAARETTIARQAVEAQLATLVGTTVAV
jgi:hypothetical protein